MKGLVATPPRVAIAACLLSALPHASGVRAHLRAGAKPSREPSVALAAKSGRLEARSNATSAANATTASHKKRQDIASIITMLETMLTTSQTTQASERTLHETFTTYCDENKIAKETAIMTAKEDIGLLENRIAELKGDTGRLSQEMAQLQKQMDENTQQQTEAQNVRDKEKTDYDAMKASTEAGVGQLTQALSILTAVGADQTLAENSDNAQFMAGFTGLVALKTNVKHAMVAARSFLKPGQEKELQSFLQARAPFTGTYTSQSGEVLGILKNMKETFEANLEAATKAEEAALAAHTEFMRVKGEEYTELSGSFNGKQAEAGTNDGELSTKKTALGVEVTTKDEAEEFLGLLVPMCEEKAKQFEARSSFQKAEEAAISKAIEILSSDSATNVFDTIDAVGGTGPASFLQLPAAPSQTSPKASVALMKLLLLAARKGGARSKKIGRVVAMLQAGNPFKTVLEQIEKMIKLNEAEAKLDQEQKDWCESERTTNDASIDEKATDIQDLDTKMTDLGTSIDDPATGLKFQVTEKEGELATCDENQASETTTRREEHAVYLNDIRNLVSGGEFIQKAIYALQAFYSEAAQAKHQAKVSASSMLLSRRRAQKIQELLRASRKGGGKAAAFATVAVKDEPAPPDTWTDPVAADSQGAEVIGLLETLHTNTKAEETAAHAAEETAQNLYETSMSALKTEQQDLTEALGQLKELLAKTEKDLEDARMDLEKTEADKLAVERYLDTIKAGCDFVVDNFDARKTARDEEDAALQKAVTLIEGTPAFAAGETADLHASWGDCKDVCLEHGESDANCQACLTGVSVPGYCTGHPGTPGC